MNKLIDIIQQEEDCFPKILASYEKRPYGYLFYDPDNKSYYDSNHALLFRDQIDNLEEVLDDLVAFYKEKDIHPSIYQSLRDPGFFTDNQAVFEKKGFRVWLEDPAHIMVLNGPNKLGLPGDIQVKRLDEWDKRIENHICLPAQEAYNIGMFKRLIKEPSATTLVAYKDHEALGILSFHVTKTSCRFDYILMAPKARNKGYASQLLSYAIDYCQKNKIKNCFQWPAHKQSEYICYKGGFRTLFTTEVARASYRA